MSKSQLLIGLAALTTLLGAGLVAVGMTDTGAQSSPSVASAATATSTLPTAVGTNTPTPSATAPTTVKPSRTCSATWGCVQQDRFTAAKNFLAKQNGHINIVVRDRRTGAVWRAGETSYQIWAGSTPKLALAAALRERARAGEITLDDTANQQIADALKYSDNDAATALWKRYGGSSNLTRFQEVYGMHTATYVSGFPKTWGFIKCTAQDLANLMSYILDKMNKTDRDYLIQAMRTVDAIQHWGVWSAGAALDPGVKDGWSVEKDNGSDHWITATVGFAGPDERYVVAAMYHQPPGGDTIAKGVHVLSDLIATVFGQPVPAPVTIPDRD